MFWSSIVKVKSFLSLGTQELDSNRGTRWTRESSGIYSVGSGYSLISERNATEAGRGGGCSNRNALNKFWKALWAANIPPRVRLHAWRTVHNGLPDGDTLDRRCGIDVVACGWCGWKKDSIMHIVRDCWMGKLMGLHFDINADLYKLEGGNPADWFFSCFSTLAPSKFRTLLSVCWILWTSRNDYVHSGRLWQLEEMALKVSNILRSAASRELANIVGRKEYSSVSLKVFCDSSWKWNTVLGHGKAGWGIVVKSNEVILAINANGPEESPSSDHAEGMALYKGLSLGDALDLSEAMFLTDSMAVIRMLALGCGMSQPPSWLSHCLQLLNVHKDWRVDWIPRNCNVIADSISKKARKDIWSWNRTDAIPYAISSLLKAD